MRFYDPIILPDGRKLLTLRDAAEYITALPKAEHVLPASRDGNAAESARRLLLLLNTTQIIDNSEDACSHDDFRI